MAEDPENFADYPKSLGEHRATAQWDGRQWSPRDALIDLLRRIDRGETRVETLVIAYRQRDDQGVRSRFMAAGVDLCDLVGLLTYAAHLAMEQHA